MSEYGLYGKESNRLREEGIQIHGYLVDEKEELISLSIKERDVSEMYEDSLNNKERNLLKMLSAKEKKIRVDGFFDNVLSKRLKKLGYALEKPEDDKKNSDSETEERPRFVISRLDLEKIHSEKRK